MKKWFSIISSIVIIVLLSCGMIALHGHNQRNYNYYIHLGSNDVIDSHYLGAMNYFQGAHRVDLNRTQAKEDLMQTQSYISGLHYFRKRQFNHALKEYRRSTKIDGISALNRRSKLRYDRVKSLINNLRSFTKLYNQALILNHGGKYKASNASLNKIVNNPRINHDYFHRFKMNVKKLITANDKKKWSNLGAGLSINQDQVSQFRLKTPRVITNHPSKVTIKKARHVINRAGVNAQKMNNRDVANLIRQAKKHGSTIYSYAKRNY